jgi:hypothetical protein
MAVANAEPGSLADKLPAAMAADGSAVSLVPISPEATAVGGNTGRPDGGGLPVSGKGVPNCPGTARVRW